jgi:hypothetical protein
MILDIRETKYFIPQLLAAWKITGMITFVGLLFAALGDMQTWHMPPTLAKDWIIPIVVFGVMFVPASFLIEPVKVKRRLISRGYEETERQPATGRENIITDVIFNLFVLIVLLFGFVLVLFPVVIWYYIEWSNNVRPAQAFWSLLILFGWFFLFQSAKDYSISRGWL